jgi:hypothetical protein
MTDRDAFGELVQRQGGVLPVGERQQGRPEGPSLGGEHGQRRWPQLWPVVQDRGGQRGGTPLVALGGPGDRQAGVELFLVIGAIQTPAQELRIGAQCLEHQAFTHRIGAERHHAGLGIRWQHGLDDRSDLVPPFVLPPRISPRRATSPRPAAGWGRVT